MTITFVPGQPNTTDVLQCIVDSRLVIVYASGNNLVIVEDKDLHTLHLPSDPLSIAVNEKLGLVAVGLGKEIYIYSIDSYSLDLVIPCLSPLSLDWAVDEAELIVGGSVLAVMAVLEALEALDVLGVLESGHLEGVLEVLVGHLENLMNGLESKLESGLESKLETELGSGIGKSTSLNDSSLMSGKKLINGSSDGKLLENGLSPNPLGNGPSTQISVKNASNSILTDSLPVNGSLGTKNGNINTSLAKPSLKTSFTGFLSLYHIYDYYGTLKYTQRWYLKQPSPVNKVSITPSGSKILSTSNRFDRFVKLWLRNCYGDSSLFSVSYLDHPKGLFVTSFQWRKRTPVEVNNKVTDKSLAKIKNISEYINNNNNSYVAYTVTNDNILRVWASYENLGDYHLQKCFTKDLNILSEPTTSVVIIENFYIQKTLLSNENCPDLDSLNLVLKKFDISKDSDLVLVVGRFGKCQFLAIKNIEQSPFDKISIEDVVNLPELDFNENTFPRNSKVELKELSLEYLNSPEFLVQINPILFSLSHLHHGESSPLSILVHDKLKSTLRVCSFNFSCLWNDDMQLGTSLLHKFQGQTKSIQKLVKSTSLYSKNNVLLSILNFPDLNFVWCPIYLNHESSQPMTITKRFRIEINPTKGNRILDAVLVNDIQHKDVDSRRHLVATIEEEGYISLWDCNTLISDDQPGVLVKRIKIVDKDNALIKSQPKSLLTVNSTDEHNQFDIIAIFEKDFIKGWKVSMTRTEKEITAIDMTPIIVQDLPQEENIHLATKFNSIINKDDKDILSVIDSNGVLRIYSLDFTFSKYGVGWKQSYVIDTSIKNASKIHGSDVIEKVAVVDESKLNLSIWEIKTGVLEFEETYPKEYGSVRDLDWTFLYSSNDQLATNAILSVGFDKFVLLYTQLRYDYTNKMPTFAVIEKVDTSSYTSHKIGDLIWLNDCYLVIASGNQFYIDDKWIRSGSKLNNSIDSIIRQLMIGYAKPKNDDGHKKVNDDLIYDINHLVAILNGPLPIYHPQFVIQALYMNQMKFVQDIFVQLFQALRRGKTIVGDLNMDMEKVILTSLISRASDRPAGFETPSNFYDDQSTDVDIFEHFNSALADMLIEKLMKITLPLLTRHQQSTLVSLISIVKYLKKASSSLDSNGCRFLLGFKLYQVSPKQAKLNVRDISWALHSNDKDVLLSAVEEHFKFKLSWDNVNLTGLVFWVRSSKLIGVIEQVARTEFSNNRNPSGIVSLLYLALRKKQILIGLWRTVSHPEQQKMLKFLSNDFTEPRWKSAAVKNAFVLIGQHRYIDAAYFFLLGDSVNDCCRLLAGKVDDLPLAIAISKVYASSDSEKHHSHETNESLKVLIENHVIPRAISDGDRWICSWIFWQLHLKELSIQALIKSPISIISENSQYFSEFCRDHYINKLQPTHKGQSFLKDDPVLILMFNNLRLNKLNYLRGSLNITQLEEANFIIKVCTIYNRMGCEYLALILLRNWKFIEIDAASKLEWQNKTSQIENSEFKRSMSIDFTPQKLNRKPSIIRRTSIVDTNIKEEAKNGKPPPPPTEFEEPDMSSFDFGF